MILTVGGEFLSSFFENQSHINDQKSPGPYLLQWNQEFNKIKIDQEKNDKKYLISIIFAGAQYSDRNRYQSVDRERSYIFFLSYITSYVVSFLQYNLSLYRLMEN